MATVLRNQVGILRITTVTEGTLQKRLPARQSSGRIVSVNRIEKEVAPTVLEAPQGGGRLTAVTQPGTQSVSQPSAYFNMGWRFFVY